MTPRAARASKDSVAFLTKTVTPESVARRIVHGLEHRRRVVVVPRLYYPSVVPQTITRAVAEWFMGRTALRAELPGGENAPALTERAGDGSRTPTDGGRAA